MGDLGRGSRRLTYVVAALLACLAFAGWVQFNLGGATATLYADDLATAGAALLACVLCLGARRRGEPRMRRFWALLGAAAAAWALAEGVWAVYDLALGGDVPVVSWADVGYLSAIPLTVAALVSHPALHGSGARTARSLLDGLTIAAALLFLSWTLVLGPLWKHSDLDTLGGMVAFSYPFGDAVIVFFVVLAVRGMTRADRASMWCLLGGLLAMSLSDTLYAYLTGVKDFTPGGLIDAGWFAGYLGIALSARLAHATPGEMARARDAAQQAPPLASLVAPFLPLLLALGVLAGEIQLGHRPDRVGFATAFALVGLVLIRQALMPLELRAQERVPATGSVL